MGKIEFQSNGKLLLTGEYLVMHGALALALPVKFGQQLSIEAFNDEHPMIHWRTWIKDELWFEAEFSTPYFKIISTSNATIANKLSEYFIALIALNPNFIDSTRYYQAHATLDFDINWGLGSSSSLINNLADWAGIDPYKLHEQVSSGSGYDIATSRSNKAVLYKKTANKPEVEQLTFNPSFKDSLYFAWSGKKQDTAESLDKYRRNKQEEQHDAIEKISSITRKILKCDQLDDFNELIAEHEKITGSVLNTKPIKHRGFSDFDGQVKSLGAWGGDFLLFTWKNEREELRKYLEKKDIHQIFSFDEIIKQAE